MVGAASRPSGNAVGSPEILLRAVTTTQSARVQIADVVDSPTCLRAQQNRAAEAALFCSREALHLTPPRDPRRCRPQDPRTPSSAGSSSPAVALLPCGWPPDAS